MSKVAHGVNIYVILYDSLKEITRLFADKIKKGDTLLLPDKNKAFQLDEYPGTETVYILASNKKIEDFGKRLYEVKKIGINEIHTLFPKCSIQSFSFRHKPSPSGDVCVDTVPEGARVWINGKDKGMSPVCEKGLKVGTVQIWAVAEGYKDKVENVIVEEGVTVRVNLYLDSKVPSVLPSANGIITNSLKMEFVYIEPDTFMMGSPENEPGRFDREIQHKVTLTKDFYMQTTEVTQGQWKAVMGDNPSSLKCSNCPVESVSWFDVQEFIRKLNQMEKTDSYRLPTEAEWEYAARAESDTAYCFGNDVEKLKDYAWYGNNSDRKIHPAARLKPNAWGLYDMHGNVWEWVQDWYDEYSKESVTDPVGPDRGSSRVVRGGGWNDYARDCRSACRINFSSDHQYNYLGFRLLREAH